MSRPPPGSSLFPYTTLFRSCGPLPELEVKIHNPDLVASITLVGRDLPQNPELIRKVTKIIRTNLVAISQDSDSAILYLSQDRKSTRLNSSHANISYAVFCLK